MIRRDVRLADSAAGWALISQVEHARISAQLAAHCLGRFGGAQPSEARDEILAAIACHDGGWAEWERAPRLDARLRRPLSFMELEIGDAIAIWGLSIKAAERCGPLAAWMVSGHFARLLDHSEHARLEPQTAQWLAEMAPRRTGWLAAWRGARSAANAQEVADEALQWLWTFDEVSLWFCCYCPVGGEVRGGMGKPYLAGRGTAIEMELVGEGAEVGDDPARGVATALPWRFGVGSIDVDTSALILPVARYDDPKRMLAAGEPTRLRWRMTAKESAHEFAGPDWEHG